MNDTLVILAAGNSSRFGELKQFCRFGPLNKTLMEYNIDNAYALDYKKVVFVIQPRYEDQLKSQVIDNLCSDIETHIVFQDNNILPDNCTVDEERTGPLGTAHAIWCCKDYVDDNFIVLNGDDYYGKEAFSIISKINHNDNSHYLVSYKIKKTLSENGGVNRAICTADKDNYLTRIYEATHINEINGKCIGNISGYAYEIDENSLVSMNFWLFHKDIFIEISHLLTRTFAKNNQKPNECYISDFVEQEINKGLSSIKLLESSEQWLGVTFKQDAVFVNDGLKKVID